MRVPCGTALAFSVESPCPPKMTILRLCHCMAICQISSFVSEACDAASASSALSAFAELTWGLVGRRQVWDSPGSIRFHVAVVEGAHVESDSLASPRIAAGARR